MMLTMLSDAGLSARRIATFIMLPEKDKDFVI